MPLDFLPTDEQIIQMVMLVLPIVAIVMLYGYRHGIMAWAAPRAGYLVPFAAVVGGGALGTAAGGWWSLVGAVLGLAIVGLFRLPPTHAYVTSSAGAENDAAVSPDADAVNENPETAKSPGIDPVLVDKMIAAAVEKAVREARAQAVGTLEGRGLLIPGTRAKALDALGIRGALYQNLKPKVDAAQAAAQSEPPTTPAPESRAVKVHAGRPDEYEVAL